ncbi:MBL fold metallo-hydrolase [Candidatus Woesearchaeota archaeon]|nr:MBL fold metallo-hydrolase [Candidatus Woesearchaeota archaeon]
MELIFHGGAGEVGRSCIEIATGRKRLLLDCGLKLTQHGSEYPTGFERVDDIQAVFISHAHLDHTGALPLMDHKGLDCPIFMTKATKQLTRLLLKDAFKIGKITHQHLGYSEADIKDVLNCIKRVKMDAAGEIDGVKYEYFDAGHIPGAASVWLDVDGTRILYTGDIKTTDTQLHTAAETDFPEVDVMICESTYGDRDHPSRPQTEEKFVESIKSTIAAGGSVLIPAFAVGRAQELLLVLAKHNFNAPVYLDGMGITAADIALDNPESIRSAKTLKAALGKARIVRTRQDRLKVLRGQAIIVTTSGMLTGGPVLSYLKQVHEDPKNAVLLTGYQAEETNGRLLLESGDVYIDGWKHKVKCKVEQYDFSAHDGLTDLKRLVRKVRPQKVVFNHGEEKSVQNLREWADALGMDAYAPKLGDVIDI